MVRGRRPLSGCVYVVGHTGGSQKVGKSSDARQRVRTLETKMGRGLIVHSTETMPYDLLSGCEQRAHEMLKPWWICEEMFDVPPTYAVEAVREAAQEVRGIYLATSCVRDARACLGWTVQKLADRSGISTHTVCEASKAQYAVARVSLSSMRAIRRALETAGVGFIPENGGGPGVRLRKPGQCLRNR